MTGLSQLHSASQTLRVWCCSQCYENDVVVDRIHTGWVWSGRHYSLRTLLLHFSSSPRFGPSGRESRDVLGKSAHTSRSVIYVMCMRLCHRPKHSLRPERTQRTTLICDTGCYQCASSFVSLTVPLAVFVCVCAHLEVIRRVQWKCDQM